MRPGSRGKDLQDDLAKALDKAQSAIEGPSGIAGHDRDGSKSMSTTQENEPAALGDGQNSQRVAPASGARRRGYAEVGMAAKPRRLSQSPKKQPERPAAGIPFPDVLPDDFNPFQKKGLRRSPIGSSADAPSAAVIQDSTAMDETFNPFRKTGLRRSPILSQPVETVPRTSPAPSQHLEGGKGLADGWGVSPIRSQPVNISPRKSPFPSRSALRRSPVFSQDFNTVQQTDHFSDQVVPDTQDQIPIPSEQSPSSRKLFAESKSPLEVPESENASIEPRHQEASTPVETTPKPKMRFADMPAAAGIPTEALTYLPEPVPKPLHEPTISTTPSEPPPQLSSIVESRNEILQQPKPFPVPRSTPISEVSKTDETGHDLFDGALRVEELDLPPAATQLVILDPVVTTSATVIHNTPSKKPRTRKALSDRLTIPPVKPRNPSPRKPVEPVTTPELKPEKPKRRKSARFLIPDDPHAAKKKARDNLLKELQQLQADVAFANRENERLRMRSESRKEGLPVAPNPDELQSLLLRSTAPELSSENAPKPTSIFKSINAFLPFRPRRRPAAAPVSEKPLPSHLPVTLNDPLPYLQAFSPLKYSSTISLLPAERAPSDTSSPSDEQPILQKHVITASHPSGLFSTRFSMTVNTSSLSIAALNILRLDMNAEKELGTFIRARARSDNVLGKDITVVCWAMSRWIEVSIQRARFWCTIEHEFGTPQARARTLLKKRKRKRQGAIEAAVDHMETDEFEESQVWTRRQLLPHIGRTGAELSNAEVEMRFEWKITFDWTGEVESAISASARVPGSCK